MTHNEKHPGAPASLYIGNSSAKSEPGIDLPEPSQTNDGILNSWRGGRAGGEIPTVSGLSLNQRGLLDKQFTLIAEKLGEIEALKKQVADAAMGNLTRSNLISDLMDRVAKLESRGQRCQKCGQYKNEPGICWSFDGPDGYPEPNGEHEWK